MTTLLCKRSIVYTSNYQNPHFLSYPTLPYCMLLCFVTTLPSHCPTGFNESFKAQCKFEIPLRFGHYSYFAIIPPQISFFLCVYSLSFNQDPTTQYCVYFNFPLRRLRLFFFLASTFFLFTTSLLKPSSLSIPPILCLFSFPTSSLLPNNQSNNLSVSLSSSIFISIVTFPKNTQQHQRKRINFRQSKTKTAIKRRRSKENQTTSYFIFDVLGPKMCPGMLWPPRLTLLPTTTFYTENFR